jgi:hypothetical protein
MPHSPSLRSLFLAWVCFSLAFSAVIQAFLTTFLVDSGYETPIKNMDELFASGIKLAYRVDHSFIFENGDETEASKVKQNHVYCPSFHVCVEWANYHKNISILLSDNLAKMYYAIGDFVGENSEPFLCPLEDGVVFSTGLTMIIFIGDPLLRRVNKIIGRVIEAGIYNYWTSQHFHWIKLEFRKIAIVQLIDEYYSFNFYHIQPAFYLLLIGWCLSALCFIFEVMYNRLLNKRKLCL